MEQQSYYIYQNSQQTGPFTKEQLLEMRESHSIQADAYLYLVGWKDWRPFEECLVEFDGVNEDASPKRRAGAPRATVSGRIIVHNNGELLVGSGVNISPCGMFIETRDHLFEVGETLKLSVRCDCVTAAFNATASVVRYNTDVRYPVGYGLRFESIDASVVSTIEKFVSEQNSFNVEKKA